jgi:predicted NAD/FAD-binding protein
VSLNSGDYIDPEKVIQTFKYSHPIFSDHILEIQKAFYSVNTADSLVLFCGAYWGNGFHEDGLNSGIQVAKLLGAKWP